MIEQYVQANSLSCLMNEDRTIEIIPEPFRMQGSVSFRVTYSEYSNYILSLPKDTGVILMSELSYLRNLASSDNPKLYSCFLKDLAFAICKEVWFSECYAKDASIILPASYISKVMTVSAILQSYLYCRDVESELLGKVQSAGFKPFKTQRIQNIRLVQLAVVLYSMSKVPNGVEEVNLVYDLVT
jgi:hypothetical protein